MLTTTCATLNHRVLGRRIAQQKSQMKLVVLKIIKIVNISHFTWTTHCTRRFSIKIGSSASSSTENSVGSIVTFKIMAEKISSGFMLAKLMIIRRLCGYIGGFFQHQWMTDHRWQMKQNNWQRINKELNWRNSPWLHLPQYKDSVSGIAGRYGFHD